MRDFLWVIAGGSGRRQAGVRVLPQGRRAPEQVLAERETVWAAEVTPNMALLGDPLPGRSALDAKHRGSSR